MKLFLLPLLAFFIPLLLSGDIDTPKESQLKKMIGRMLIVGFDTPYVDANSSVVHDMSEYNLGGVILFDRFYNDRNKTKNIASPKQLKKLTTQLQSFSKEPLFIAIDQEGGRVARLKPEYGFAKIPSAQAVTKLPKEQARSIYAMKKRLKCFKIWALTSTLHL